MLFYKDISNVSVSCNASLCSHSVLSQNLYFLKQSIDHMIVFKDDKNQINLNKFIPPKLKFEIATYDISVTQI